MSSAAQEKPASPDPNNTPSSRRPLPSKKQPANAEPVEEREPSTPGSSSNNADSAEAIRKRAEWFYKQRSSVKGHIPAGVRLKALKHMQRMMLAEGKLVQRPDGTYIEVSPQSSPSPQGAVTTTWASVGPTPTTGGFFSPVTGRITTIAVDPSDATGNTVLVGGAMGGIWRSTDAGATWTAVGDQNASLAMGSIAFAPSSPSTVYAGTGESESVAFDIYYGAGVLKSTDHGQTWTQTCTVASSTCPFIGPYDDVTPFGFFTLGGTRITYVTVNPTNPQMVLVAAQTQFAEGTTEGVYCTDNGGSTWSNILPDELSSFVGFVSSSVAYAALGNPFGSSSGAPNGNGIYKATGIGSTCPTIHFSRLTAATLPAQSSIGRIDIGIAPSDTSGNTLYASIADASIDPTTGFRRDSTTNLGVFVTTNGGTSWTPTSAPDVCQFQCWYDNVVKVDPTNPGIAFFGGSSVSDSTGNPSWVVRTTNGGGSWSSVIPNLPGGSAGLPHVDNHAIAFVKLPTGRIRMYLGNDGGIWRTDDAEASTITWTNLNNPGLTLTQFYPFISMNASQPAISFGGTQDNGSQNYQGGTAWVDNQQCGDGASTAVDSVIPSTVYIGCATGFPVNVSYQNGAIGTFAPAVSGINPNDFSSFIPPLVADPSSANTVYFGTTGVYQSVDSAVTWTPITGPLANGPGDYIAVLAAAPGNSSVVYAGGFHGGVFVATNVGAGTSANFSQVSGQLTLPPRAATAIAVDPADKTGMTAYVAFSGFSFVSTSLGVNDPTGHVFKTTNGGATWTDVSCSVAVCTTPAATDLPNIPVNDLVIDPDVPGTLYAATDLGVFVGNCSTSPCTWSTLSTGLPRVAVLSLRLHEPSRTLRAATHGRGAWDINLNNFSFTGPHISSLSPVSIGVGAASLTLTVNGSGLTNGSVEWNGSATGVTTTPISDTQLTASIATSLLASTGTPKITVVVNNLQSNTLTFAVLAGTPTITSINPPSTPVQPPLANIPIQLTGTNFAASSKALFNGGYNGITVAAPTASCPLPTCLSATLPSALLGPYGTTNSISVVNLPPGGGQSKPVNFQVVAPPPTNDNFANAVNITSLFLLDVQDSSGATTETTDPTPPCAHQYTPAQGNSGGHLNGAYNTIWYKFTPIFSANLNVDTTGSSYDTVLSIWTGSQGSFTNVACNDDINPGIIQSQLLGVPLTAGTTYYIMVSSFGPPDPNPIALGGRSQLNFTYNNDAYPVPSITSISPTTAKSGDAGFTLTASGTNFFNGATVQFQDPVSHSVLTLSPVIVSSSQLTVAIPASAILFPGTYPVYVFSPGPVVQASNPINFAVTVGVYPVPVLNSISPTTVVGGGILPVTIYAIGTNFDTAAVINFNGTALQTSSSLHTSAQASIPLSALTTPGTVQVTISNPSPGGGPSNSLPFTITTPNPVPTIASLSPNTGPNNATNFVLTVNGTNFLQGATLVWNLTNLLSTTYVSSTQLTANVPGYLVAAAGSFPVNIVDPAPGGTSNAVNFTVTGPPPDFSLNLAGGPTSQTVTAGQTATFGGSIYVFALNGFAGMVNLSCSLPAAGTSCSASPSSVPPQLAATFTVTTTAHSMAPPLYPIGRFHLRPEWVPIFLLTLLLAAISFWFARTRRRRLLGALSFAVLVLIFVLQPIGCGGGGSSGPPPQTGTPAGTYTVTVTGTTSTSNGTLTHTTTLTLTVN